MSKHIIGIKMSNTGNTHEAISDYLFKDDSTAASDWKTKINAVAWVRSHQGETSVVGPLKSAVVYVVENNGRPYLRTAADRTYTDNLLSLPKY